MTPKYRIIKDYLKANIEKGIFKPDETIESENELTRHFNVSNITVRRALQELSNEGYIYRIQGKGSFVANINKDNKNKTGSIAVIFSLIKYYNDIFIDIIKGIQSYLEKENYTMTLFYYEKNPEKEKETLISLLNKKNVDGVILYSYDPSKNTEVFSKFRRNKFPLVLIDRYPLNFPVNYVTSDGNYSAYDATDYLISQGHKRIAFVSSELNVSSVLERIKGYQDALLNNGISADRSLIFDNDTDSLNKITDKILNRDITAVLIGNRSTMLEFINILQSKNINIPGDVSIIAYNNIDENLTNNLVITSINQPFFEIGFNAAKMIFDDMDDYSYTSKRMIIPCNITFGNSCKELK